MNKKKIQIYDPPMCCSSGVCGPNVNPELARFSSDLDWLKKQGVEVERFSLSSNPAAFAGRAAVKKALSEEGNECLPLIIIDDSIVSRNIYPTRMELAKFLGIIVEEAPREKSENASCCGPDCGCGAPTASGKTKVVIGIIVLLIACGIFVYKMTNTKPAALNAPASAFVAGNEKQNTPVGKPERDKTKDNASVNAAAGKVFIGEYLESLNSLNKVAVNHGVVFILIPAKKDETVKPETVREVLAAQQTLKSQGINIGLYTLKTGAPDYSGIAKQTSLPIILVASKGKGMAVLTGEVTQTKLMQAFVASSCAGGSGCGPSSSGCK